jgi:hypothetical protein
MLMATITLQRLLPLILLVCACNTAPKTQLTKTDITVNPEVKTYSKAPVATTAATGKADAIFRDISGYYEEVDDEQTEELKEGCGISVAIKKTAKGFSYYLKTRDTHHSGKVTLVKTSNQKYGIVFEGIKYAEYEGDISKDPGSADVKELDPPAGIGGELEQDTITIQNSGNAMNYYVQIGSCQVKYIRLVKVK